MEITIKNAIELLAAFQAFLFAFYLLGSKDVKSKVSVCPFNVAVIASLSNVYLISFAITGIRGLYRTFITPTYP